VRTVLFGIHSPSTLEKTLGAHADQPQWPQLLTLALATFHDCRWPLDLLSMGA
jgi:hypothetical protein